MRSFLCANIIMCNYGMVIYNVIMLCYHNYIPFLYANVIMLLFVCMLESMLGACMNISIDIHFYVDRHA